MFELLYAWKTKMQRKNLSKSENNIHQKGRAELKKKDREELVEQKVETYKINALILCYIINTKASFILIVFVLVIGRKRKSIE